MHNLRNVFYGLAMTLDGLVRVVTLGFVLPDNRLRAARILARREMRSALAAGDVREGGE